MSCKWETSCGSRHGSTSLLNAFSFYRQYNGPVQYRNDLEETTVVEEGYFISTYTTGIDYKHWQCRHSLIHKCHIQEFLTILAVCTCTGKITSDASANFWKEQPQKTGCMLAPTKIHFRITTLFCVSSILEVTACQRNSKWCLWPILSVNSTYREKKLGDITLVALNEINCVIAEHN